MKHQLNIRMSSFTSSELVLQTSSGVKALWIAALVFVAGSLAVQPAHAQTTISHWSFDSLNSGVYADTTGNHDATVVGAGATLSTGTQGTDYMFGGGAASFDGNDSYATASSLSSQIGSSSFTISVWANLAANDWGNQVLSDWAGPNSYIFGFNGGNSGLLWALNKSDGSGNIAGGFGSVDSAGMTLNNWHHVAYVFDRAGDGSSATISYYLDGNLEATSFTLASGDGYTGSLYDTSSGTTWIGQKQDNQHGWDGQMDELWVIGGALDQTQIQDLMVNNSFSPVPEPATMAIIGLGCVVLGAVGVRRRA